MLEQLQGKDKKIEWYEFRLKDGETTWKKERE